MIIDATLGRAFAPGGTLRASINLGNPLLAQRGQEGAAPTGLSVELAGELAARLGLGLEFVCFEGAAASVEALREGRADLGFFAVDPERGAGLRFSRPYVLIEGSYLVRSDSPILSNDEVDRGGIRVVVGKGSAYDLFLSRTIKSAELVRAPSSPAVVGTFLEGGYEVAAGVRQQLEADSGKVLDAAGRPFLRLLPGRFMIIEQAMAVPAARDPAVGEALEAFVADIKASGFLGTCIARLGLRGLTQADSRA
ncbi:MAG: transporter substrate-binding domain-containing protein [Rectinemataceae bacterium]